MPTTSSVTIVTLGLMLSLSACDDGKGNKDAPAKTPAAKKGADGKADGKADAKAEAEAAPAGRVFFVKPADGATVPEQFEVEFGVEGKQVRPAGATERDLEFGHHHLLIDVGPIADMTIVPKDEKHLHYGDGATKATVKLPPGKHQLTMQFADGAHRSYGEDWAATISVEVQAGEAAPPADGGAAPAADGAAAPVADEGGEAG